MAAIDVEEQQHLLEGSTQSRRLFGRLAWVATGLSAAAVAAVIWHNSADTSMRSATTPDTFTKLVKLNKAFGKIRKLAEQTAQVVLPDAPEDAPTKTELQDVTCDLDKLNMEICDAEEKDLVTRCQESCVAGYRQLVAACPPNHIFATASRDQLSACSGQLHGAGEKKAEEKEAEALAEEFADDESKKQQALALKCMPLMLDMTTACKMDQPGNVDLDSICAKECQDAVKTLGATCSGLGEMPLDALTGMCGECARAAFALGQPDSAGEEACKGADITTGKFDACITGCHPYMCAVLEKCPADQEPGIPGVAKKDIDDMRKHITKNTKKCPCDGA